MYVNQIKVTVAEAHPTFRVDGNKLFSRYLHVGERWRGVDVAFKYRDNGKSIPFQFQNKTLAKSAKALFSLLFYSIRLDCLRPSALFLCSNF